MIARIYRLCLLLVLSLLTRPVWSQERPKTTPPARLPAVEVLIPKTTNSPLTDPLPKSNRLDSLFTKRGLLATAIFERGKQLTKAEIRSRLDSTPAIVKVNRLGKVLKPIGPALCASGLVVGYLGLKGTETIKMVRGIRPPGSPAVPDVPVNYTVRSLPTVLGGLGLFIGGLCLIELSNELTVKSVKLYNTKVSQKNAQLQSVSLKLGVTTSGNLGFEAHF